MIKKGLTSALLLSTILSSAAYAQTERLPGVVDREPVGVEINKEKMLNKKKSPLEIAPQKSNVDSDEQVLDLLKGVSFSGNSILSSDELMHAAQPYVGQPLTKSKLANLKYDLTNEFYKRGYILVKVITPPQNITNGVLQVEIHEAKIGEVHIVNNSKLKDSVVNALAKRIASNSVFQERDAETVISDIDDLENIEASVTLKPGKKFKTTDVVLTVADAEEDTQKLVLDTYGSELTGKHVATGFLKKSNAFGLGETIKGTVRKSDGNLWSSTLGFSVPLQINNLMLEGTYVHSENEIGDRLAALDSEGKSDIFNIAVSSNILNTRDYTAQVRAGFEARNHESTLGASKTTDTKDAVRQVFVESSFLKSNVDSVYFVSTKLIKGVDLLGESDRNRLTFANGGFASRAGANPEAWILKPTALSEFKIAENGSLRLFATGQLSSNVLLSSDLFVLGGYGSVRGFEPAYETGEEGYSFTVEYNHEFFLNPEWTVAVGPFLDGGAVYNDLNVGLNDSHIYSTGVGAEVTTRAFNGEATALRFDYAHPLGSYNDTAGIKDDHRFYFRLSQGF